MITSLLRAMAHIKAAALHIEKARAILRGHHCYWHIGAEAGGPAEQSIGVFIGRVKERYADEVHDQLDPAPLP